MFERWDTLITIGKRSRVENEIHQVLAKSSEAKLKREAAFERVRLEINDAARSGVLPVQHINECIKLERKLKSEDVRGPLVVKSCGVFAVPAVFVIDAAGNVYSPVQPRAKPRRIGSLRRDRTARVSRETRSIRSYQPS